MFKKVFIANRGLPAANCVKAVRELGSKSVVAYEGDDLRSVATRTADEVIAISSATKPTAYLDVEAMVAAVVQSGADAVHPGYGFLAKNQEFAEKIKAKGIAFIGNDFGTQPELKDVASQSGLAVLPSTGVLHNWNDVDSAAPSIGFPLVIKALDSYSGWGVRVVRSVEELRGAWDYVSHQCERHQVSSEVVLEKYLSNAHQVEFPVLRDQNGRCLVLPELDTTVQRRFQKLLVESPSPVMKKEIRSKIESALPVLLNKINLVGYATVEFLVTGDDAFFLDVEGGVQAAHSVTGLLTGLNIMREQIRLHAGEALTVLPEHIKRQGHVLGVFIYAMDPYKKFAPSPGKVEYFQSPAGEGIILQSAVAAGDLVSPNYDPLIAKVIVTDATRSATISRMKIALEDSFIEGVQTNIAIMRAIVATEDFAKAEINVSDLFSEEKRVQLLRSLRNEADDEVASIIAALALNTDANATQIMASAQQGGLLWSMASKMMNRKKMEF